MAIKTFIDPTRCIGAAHARQAAANATRTRREHGHGDFVDRGMSVATQPTVCMHCEDPVAPCARCARRKRS